jgi:hypothetical protein
MRVSSRISFFFFFVAAVFFPHFACILIILNMVQLFVETQMFSVLSDSRLSSFENERT